jgi:tight adherence protein B
MTLAILTFVLSLAVMMGLYWALIVRPEDRRSREIAQRVRRVDPKRDAVKSVTAELTTASVVDALLASNVSLARGVQTYLSEAGLTWTASGLMVRTVLAGVAGLVAGVFVTGSPLGAALAPLVAAVPGLYAARRRSERLRIFEEQFPEAIDLIARSLRAGHTFTTGLGIAADEVPPPVGLEFRRVHDEQNFGMAMPDALRGMAQRVPVLDARFFVTAVLTQREAGGNLAEVLDNLSSVMRDRFKVKRQIRVVSAHGRMTAWVLTLMPPILAGILYAMSPQFMRTLVDDPMGVRLVLFALVMQVIGTLVIARLVKVDY